ncbi:hypothetical protein ABZ820_32305 [Streptomyces diacarni]|uniref:DUF4352 domain-containing protein n=1 Tax=Streptomyces diacarni TaxID=2800381 RepID=A0A367F346_9ACTN|nr:hypothetical protein [Streptomyces diacarni]RCG24681.1 hypothetical protein DTL70_10015 [Streptomyces diacarni]
MAEEDPGKLYVTPVKVREGRRSDLKGVKVADDSLGGVRPPRGLPYYVDLTFENQSGEELSGPPKMFGTDSEGHDLEQLEVTEPSVFRPCPEEDDQGDADGDGLLDQFESRKVCALFVVPRGATLEELELKDVTWKVST